MKKIIVSTILGLATGFSPLFAVGNAKTSPAAGVTKAKSLTKKNKLLIGSAISVPVLATATLVLLKLKSNSKSAPDTTLLIKPKVGLGELNSPIKYDIIFTDKTKYDIADVLPFSEEKINNIPQTAAENPFDCDLDEIENVNDQESNEMIDDELKNFLDK